MMLNWCKIIEVYDRQFLITKNVEPLEGDSEYYTLNVEWMSPSGECIDAVVVCADEPDQWIRFEEFDKEDCKSVYNIDAYRFN